LLNKRIFQFYIEELSLSEDVRAGQKQCEFNDLYVSITINSGLEAIFTPSIRNKLSFANYKFRAQVNELFLKEVIFHRMRN
jgi:hypothetical protein